MGRPPPQTFRDRSPVPRSLRPCYEPLRIESPIVSLAHVAIQKVDIFRGSHLGLPPNECLTVIKALNC